MFLPDYPQEYEENKKIVSEMESILDRFSLIVVSHNLKWLVK